MLKTVFLDLDDTILDFTRAEAAALRRALTEAEIAGSRKSAQGYLAAAERYRRGDV